MDDENREVPAPSRGFGRILVLVSLAFVLCLGGYVGVTNWSQVSDFVRGAPTSTASTSQLDTPPVNQSQPRAGHDADASRQRVQVSDQRAYGDWRHACLTRDDGKRACSIVQNLLHKETRRLLLSWRIVGDGASLTSIWQTPQNVLLSSGLRIDAGLPDAVVLPYQSCNASHCVSSVRLANEFVDRMKNVPDVAVSMVLTNGQTLRFPISTKGLAAAIEDLRTGGGGN
ncbi:invasion associated locus B family protein [Aquibium sp. ELW1220]|uniref:invasion associated locus B family protein n=1 Tax=Aquibium sp. ELW1220 TaxID=2976766 RepID=UPI0025B0AAA6|nr:invasion associated locus B family protein [Aquibium sp. ELW1220]MDN2581004.1 invasion associated locus B family protein [Aquibium sp. ELW1220]